MNNKNLSQKLAHSHQSFMQTSKKNILKRRRQQFTNQHTQNEENNSFTHLNNSNTSKSLRELIVSQFHLKANESQLQDSLNMINSSDIKAVHHGIINIRQILIKDNSNLRQIVLDSTALDKILQFCQQEQYLHLKLEAAWCIANLTVGTTSQINILVKKNVIQILENVVQDQFGQIAEQGVWAIGNISSDDTKYRNLILKSNIVNILKQKLENTDSEMVKRIIWVFSNICQNSAKGEEATEQIYSLFDTIRRAFIAFDDLEIQKDCIAGIQAWMENENCRKQILQDQFLEKFLIYYSQLVKDTNQNIQQIGNCNRVLGMITSKDDEENQKILEFRFLTEIKKILVQRPLDYWKYSIKFGSSYINDICRQ